MYLSSRHQYYELDQAEHVSLPWTTGRTAIIVLTLCGALAVLTWPYLPAITSHKLQQPVAVSSSPVYGTANRMGRGIKPGTMQRMPEVWKLSEVSGISRAPTEQQSATLFGWNSTFAAASVGLSTLLLLVLNAMKRVARLPMPPLVEPADAWLALPPMAWAVLASAGSPLDLDDSDPESQCHLQLTFTRTLQEGPRPLVDYVQLPAKKYSVLDSSQVTRLSDDTFRVQFGDVRLLGLLRIAPSANVTVQVPDTGAIQSIHGVSFEGKPKRLINAMNNLFANMDWCNRVTAEPAGEGMAQIVSSITLDWTLPRTYPLKSEAMELLITRLMNFMMPWMLTKLEQDYARWSNGDDTRSAVTQGEIAQLTFDFMSENQDLLPIPQKNDPNYLNE